MKKIITVLGICLTGIAVNAQDTRPIYYFKYDSEMFQIAATIFVVGMFMYFILKTSLNPFWLPKLLRIINTPM